MRAWFNQVEANQSDAAPFVKAAIRDVKAYRDSKGYRKIPVGYSAGKLKSRKFCIEKIILIFAHLTLFKNFTSFSVERSAENVFLTRKSFF